MGANWCSNVRRLVGEITFDFGEDEDGNREERARLMSLAGRD